MMEAFAVFMAGVAEQMGLPGLVPEEDGMVSLEIDGRHTLNIQPVPSASSVVVFAEVTELPEGTPESVYRAILSGMLFGRETAGGTLALEPVGASLVYTRRFDFSPASDPGEFVAVLEQLLELTGQWRDRIARLAAEGETVPEKMPEPMPISDFFTLRP